MSEKIRLNVSLFGCVTVVVVFPGFLLNFCLVGKKPKIAGNFVTGPSRRELLGFQFQSVF